MHGYCGASEESTIQQGRQCRRAGYRDAGHRTQTVLYGMAVYGLSDSVECRVSSVKCQVSSARPVDVKSQTKGPGTMRHSKLPTSTESTVCIRPRLGSVQPPSTQGMHNRMHAHTHSRTDTQDKRQTHKSKQARRVSSFSLSRSRPGRESERASDQLSGNGRDGCRGEETREIARDGVGDTRAGGGRGG